MGAGAVADAGGAAAMDWSYGRVVCDSAASYARGIVVDPTARIEISPGSYPVFMKALGTTDGAAETRGATTRTTGAPTSSPPPRTSLRT